MRGVVYLYGEWWDGLRCCKDIGGGSFIKRFCRFALRIDCPEMVVLDNKTNFKAVCRQTIFC